MRPVAMNGPDNRIHISALAIETIGSAIMKIGKRDGGTSPTLDETS